MLHCSGDEFCAVGGALGLGDLGNLAFDRQVEKWGKHRARARARASMHVSEM